MENIKQELAKNKEMKESIKKFRDEAKKLEESDALREARRKYVSVPCFIAQPLSFFCSECKFQSTAELFRRSSARLEALGAQWTPWNVYLLGFCLFFFLVENLSSRHLAAFLSRSNNEALN